MAIQSGDGRPLARFTKPFLSRVGIRLSGSTKRMQCLRRIPQKMSRGTASNGRKSTASQQNCNQLSSQGILDYSQTSVKMVLPGGFEPPAFHLGGEFCIVLRYCKVDSIISGVSK